MDGLLEVLNSVCSAPGGLLGCLLGALCVIASFFWLPLFARPAGVGDGTLTGWEFAAEGVTNTMAQGVTPGSLLGASLPFLPAVAALVLGSLAIARVAPRVAAPRLALARLFSGVYVLGSVPLLLFFAFLGPRGLLRAGYVGAMLGYVLLLVGDLALRRAAAQAP